MDGEVKWEERKRKKNIYIKTRKCAVQEKKKRRKIKRKVEIII